MNITIYDLLRKSMGAAVLLAIVCIAFITFEYFNQSRPFLQFLQGENESGDKPNMIWAGIAFGCIVWRDVAKAIMKSLKKGMSEDERKKLGLPPP